MAQSYRALRASRWVFLILAYVFAGLNAIFGLVRLIGGGEPILIADTVELPMRAVGLLNIIGAPLSFLIFYMPSGLIQLLFEVRDRQPRV